MNILVTGNAGFIGSNLVDKLLEDKNNKVIGIDNLSTGKLSNIQNSFGHRNFIFLKTDVTSYVEMNDIFKSLPLDIVYHMAAMARVPLSIDKPLETHKVNVDGTLNLLELSTKYNVKRFVFASSSSVYNSDKLPLVETMKPNPNTPYSAQKYMAEIYCKLYHELYGLETVILRFFNVYGPRMSLHSKYSLLIPNFIVSLSKGSKPTIFGDGNKSRDFTYIDDIVRGIILAGDLSNKKPVGEIINLGAGRNITINEVTKIIVRELNSNLWPEYGPERIEAQHTLADIRKAKYILTWVPEIKFEDGIKKTISYFLANR